VKNEKELHIQNIQRLMKLNPKIGHMKKREQQKAIHSVSRRKFFDNLRDRSVKKEIVRKDIKIAQEWMHKIKF